MRPTLGQAALACTALLLCTDYLQTVNADQGQVAFEAADLLTKDQDSLEEQLRQWSLPCTSLYHNKKLDTANSDYSGSCVGLLREEHRVGPLPWEDGQEPIQESFAGHFPIRPWQQDGYHGKASMFYWFFPAIKPKVKDPPLLVWLQGGPGSSSMIGLFFENGPIQVSENMKLTRRSVSWADEYSILFIDQPVGTGYSYVTRAKDGDSDGEDDYGEMDSKDPSQLVLDQLQQELERDQQAEEQLFASMSDKNFEFKSTASREQKIKTRAPLYSKGYVKDQRGVAQDLLTFLDQFYQRYPEQRTADLYLTGESYAGKYVPAFAYGIMEQNKKRLQEDAQQDLGSTNYGFTTDSDRLIIPLKGIALGNSLTDPVSQVQIHADHAYYLGLVTRAQASQMEKLQDLSSKEAYQGRFMASYHYRQDVFEVFKNATGGVNWYDIRKGDVPNDWSRMEAFMNVPTVKDALNVFGPRLDFLKKQGVPEKEIERIERGRESTHYFKDPLVFKALNVDLMKSSAWMVSSLLDQGIKVTAFQGIFDFRDGVAGSHLWIEQLKWRGQKAFLEAERELWMVDGRLAGYVTQVPGLSRLTILGAGHLAPMDQNTNILAMIRDLVEGDALEKETVEEHSRKNSEHVV
ncbi:hypothetical protein BGZ75_004308 [Mortierella antarctica]|nr:hypothetical protein BGZ75_004308 [Mortierella antarctica]